MTEDESPITPEEMDAAHRQFMAFNNEACRSGFMTAALDMLETMKEQDVEDGEAAVLTGFVEAACQMWMLTMMGVGRTKHEAESVLLKQVRTFARKHAKPGKKVNPS